MMRKAALRIFLFLLCCGVTACMQPPNQKNDVTFVTPIEEPKITLSVPNDAIFVDQLANDTWNYLSSDWATQHHLPWSWRSESLNGGDFANTAEIGLLALSWLAAYDLQRSWSPAWEETETEVIAILDQLRAWQTGSQSQQPHGPNAYENSVFYQWYWISWDPPVVSGSQSDHLVPSIDNAWLAVSLIVIREYAESNGHFVLAQKAGDILNDMNFRHWYDVETSRFSWGDIENPQGGFVADYYSNENRIINFAARALGQLTTDEFLMSLDALEQPSGTYNSIYVEKVSWDGSYFTYSTPALFIREIGTSYGDKTILPATQAQIAYAKDNSYDVWGFSDCFDVGDGGYVQQGAPPTAMTGAPETRSGLVTPHASVLSLISSQPFVVINNLQMIANTYSCTYNSNYGFRDSVMADPASSEYGQCSSRFSALAQEWIILAIVNHENGFVWDYFYMDEGVMDAHREMFGDSSLYLPVIKNLP